MCLAVPGRLVSREERGGRVLARVDFRGADGKGMVREVGLELVPEAAPGDWVIVHLGMALDVIDAKEAQETLAAAERITAP